jgi:transcription elongation factor GreB
VSKAFTSEETEDTSVTARPVARAARGQERPITPEGYKALVAERAFLEGEARAQLGGLLEAEREGAKRQLDARLAQVVATLESVRVVHPEAKADGVVRFGSRVVLRWQSGRTQTLRLVGPDEVDLTRGWVSVDSPIARALVDQVQGSVVRSSGLPASRWRRWSASSPPEPSGRDGLCRLRGCPSSRGAPPNVDAVQRRAGRERRGRERAPRWSVEPEGPPRSGDRVGLQRGR